MKKTLIFFLLISSISYAQYTINGTLTKTLSTDWVILYKIESGQQKFVQNTTIKKETVLINGQNQQIGTFSFQFPANTKPGSYRANFKTKGAGYVDFIFNKENVSFTFHPDYPQQSVSFSESKENIYYNNYLAEIAVKQQKLDSLQTIAFKGNQKGLSVKYNNALAAIKKTQKKHLSITKGMYVQPFIKATLRANPPEIKFNVKDYLSHLKNTFFNHIDFSNKSLINSSFLLERITDYTFYINYSEDLKTQQKLYKESVKNVFKQIKNNILKRDVIVFLINQFQVSKNLELIDYLFANYYDTLPVSLQKKKFKTEKLKLLATEVGRIAPDFSWTENGKKLKLLSLSEAENYVIVFWSTECSHCLREVPQLHKKLQGNTKIKVIAFAMERDEHGWNSKKTTLPNWHHVLGLGKWQNKIARTYNINSTPTYYVLDANKKIIGKPTELSDLNTFISKL